MGKRPQSPADIEIGRLQTAWDAAETTYTAALDRAYSLTLPAADVPAAETALRAANEDRKTAYLDLLHAIDARRDGVLHDPIVRANRPISNSSAARR